MDAEKFTQMVNDLNEVAQEAYNEGQRDLVAVMRQALPAEFKPLLDTLAAAVEKAADRRPIYKDTK